MLADDLAKAQICERDGLLYAAGLAEGRVWFEWSQNGGATKAPFPDGSTSRPVTSETVDDEQPAIEALETGEIVVACSQSDKVRTYVTRDEGEHWELVGVME
jgi:hypothetical protein